MCALFRVVILWILAIGLLLPSWAADGRAIYKKHCAECHGKDGEGVKGKHDGALHGSKDLARLSRYIDKYMPEENPDKLNAKESERVAKYIYEAFYSEEARAKKNPVRIELAHLTNRQYVNTVADLLAAFVDGERKIGTELGLRGTYYDSKNFNGNKKLYDRVDREVNFDYGANGPEKTTTNEFAIQWRGSLVPDETGVYDIIVKTPIGMRLFLNDENDPAIDAWVASGELTEHRASSPLVGGRPCPLPVDCFRFKVQTNSISLQWKPPHCPQQIIPAHNLRTQRVAPTFVINTAFPADDSSVGYERGV